MSLYDDYVERDSSGNVRFPLFKIEDERAIKEIIEIIYMKSKDHKNFGFRESTETFGEYGKVARVGKKRDKPNKKWCWADVKIVLENKLEDNDTIGKLTGRSFMAIRHAKDNINLLFDRWVSENKNKCDGLSRNQQIELYGQEGYKLRAGDKN